MYSFQLQLLQALKFQDLDYRLQFCLDLQEWLEDDDFAQKLIFSDEATFNVSGKVNRHNVHIWFI